MGQYRLLQMQRFSLMLDAERICLRCLRQIKEFSGQYWDLADAIDRACRKCHRDDVIATLKIRYPKANPTAITSTVFYVRNYIDKKDYKSYQEAKAICAEIIENE